MDTVEDTVSIQISGTWRYATVALALVCGVALRAWLFTTELGVLNADEAIIGLMARDFLEGEVSVFYWGQAYGGSQTAMLTATLFAVFGTSVTVLKAVPVLLSLIVAILVWRIGRRVIGEPGAILAAAAFWVWPGVVVWSSTRQPDNWMDIVLALLAFLLILRLSETDRPAAHERIDFVFLGFVIGLGWWSSPKVFFIVPPALIWLGIKRLRDFREVVSRAWVAAPAAVIGALPWILFNVKYPLLSLQPPEPRANNGYFDHLGDFFTEALPISLGFRQPYSIEWMPPVAGLLLYGAALLGFIWLIVKRRSPTPILIACGAYPFLFSLSPFSWWVVDGRYLLLLMPFVAILLGLGFAFISRQRIAISSMGLVALAVLSLVGLLRMNEGDLTLPHAPDVHVPSDFKPLISELRREHIDAVFTDYWIAYRLSFETDEEILAAPVSGNDRNSSHTSKVRADDRSAYVFVRGSKMIDRFDQALRGLEVQRRKVKAGGFELLVPERRVLPDEIPEVWVKPGPS